jgi:3-deoxy-D-manno-octulosonate 8-phosphate phosphatase (KDO 8-P phosphatase)
VNAVFDFPLQLFTRCRLRDRFRCINLLVLDVDGVLTDGGLLTDEQGAVIKRFDVRDGLGIRMLQQVGIEVALLSGGKSGATEQRARYLGIGHCLTGVKDKPRALLDLQHKLSVAIENTAYVGDDLNDLVVRPLVGLLVSPEDGVKALRRQSDWVLNRKGGDGAVRAVAEAILDAKGYLRALERKGWLDMNG